MTPVCMCALNLSTNVFQGWLGFVAIWGMGEESLAQPYPVLGSLQRRLWKRRQETH